MMVLPDTRLAPLSTNASTVSNAKVLLQSIMITTTDSIKFCVATVTGNRFGMMKSGVTFSALAILRKLRKQQINQIVTELAPTELDADSLFPGFDIATMRAIAAIKHGHAAAVASDEEIQLCIQTLGSNSTNPEKQTLGDSLEGNSNPSPTGMHGRKESKKAQPISQMRCVWKSI